MFREVLLFHSHYMAILVQFVRQILTFKNAKKIRNANAIGKHRLKKLTI